MRGLILCSQSTDTTTTNKGMPVWPPLSWVVTAFDKMAVLGFPLSVAVTEDQYNAYTAVFTNQQLVKISAAAHTVSPLQAMLAVHTIYPGEDLFVLACDMLHMETYLLEQLLSDYQKQTAGAYVFSHGFQYEPLCGIYPAKTIAAFRKWQKTRPVTNHDIAPWLKEIKTFAVPIAADQQKYFRHFTNADDSSIS